MRRVALAGLVLISCRAADDGDLIARGTVEVPEIDLAPLVAARVVAIRVEEGATVAAGDTVATLTQSDLAAALAAQESRVRTAEAVVRDLEAGARPEELRRAEAELQMAAAESDRTAAELTRIRALAQGGAVSQQALDNAETAARMAVERRRAAHEALALLRAGTREDRVLAARADLAAARAGLRMVEARETELVLTAPVAGRVLRRLAEPGEALGPNVPVLTIGELGRAYVRVYVRAGDLARLAIGDRAVVEAAGTDGARAEGRIAAINPQAEFTPRVALTESERADLMFGVKVELVGNSPRVHPGTWVTVRLTPSAEGRVPSRDD
jgi:HlyD family secretion protein